MLFPGFGALAVVRQKKFLSGLNVFLAGNEKSYPYEGDKPVHTGDGRRYRVFFPTVGCPSAEVVTLCKNYPKCVFPAGIFDRKTIQYVVFIYKKSLLSISGHPGCVMTTFCLNLASWCRVLI